MDYVDLILVCALSVPFIQLALRMRVLTLGGGLVAAGIALCVVLARGWIYLAPLFFFLLSGVLLGRLNTNSRTDAKHGRPRDAMQVFCNGGIYALLATTHDPHAGIWMSISICTATCDTWASELGMYFRWPTVSIVNWRRAEPGLSGGISLPGTLGGLAGSFLMGVFMHGLLSAELLLDGVFAATITVVGVALAAMLFSVFAFGGMLLDSLLGATLQVKYNDGHGLSDAGTRQVAGSRWMTNDVVNLVSNAITVAVAVWVLG